jgi:geranylgeranyl pyrophosphate synthase
LKNVVIVKKTYLPLLALTVSTHGQQKELSQLFSSKDNMDEEEKVRRVMEIYNNIGLREKVERSIADEFALAKKSLDDIHADETLKTPFRELMDTLNGRKK